MRKTKRFNWPLKVEESKEAEIPEFYEGAFINMLLNKVFESYKCYVYKLLFSDKSDFGPTI